MVAPGVEVLRFFVPTRSQCPVCESPQVEAAVVTSAWTYLACQQCQHIWKHEHSRAQASDELTPYEQDDAVPLNCIMAASARSARPELPAPN